MYFSITAKGSPASCNKQIQDQLTAIVAGSEPKARESIQKIGNGFFDYLKTLDPQSTVDLSTHVNINVLASATAGVTGEGKGDNWKEGGNDTSRR